MLLHLVAALAVSGVVALEAFATADVRRSGATLTIEVRIVSGPSNDGNHGIVLENILPADVRIRQRAFGDPTITSSACRTNPVFNDVVCPGALFDATEFRIFMGDGNDRVRVQRNRDQSPCPTGSQSWNISGNLGDGTDTLDTTQVGTPPDQCPEDSAQRTFVFTLSISGGPGVDTIDAQQASRAVLDGALGADTLRGSPGPDTLTGGDEFQGPGDTLSGRGAADSLLGGAGNDTLDGGEGRDTYNAGTGADTLNARDGAFDEISCGDGFDTVTGDLADFLTGAPTLFLRNTNGRDCESIDMQAIDDGPPGHAVGRTLQRAANGMARVTVACPPSARIACRGTLTVRRGRPDGRIVGKARYAARLGGRAAVRVRVRAASRGTRVFVETVERGVSKKGPRRSVRLLRIV